MNNDCSCIPWLYKFKKIDDSFSHTAQEPLLPKEDDHLYVVNRDFHKMIYELKKDLFLKFNKNCDITKISANHIRIRYVNEPDLPYLDIPVLLTDIGSDIILYSVNINTTLL